MQNGDTYLERHLRSVIGRIEADPLVTLAAFGVGFDVDRYYHRSGSATEIPTLPDELSGLVVKSIAEVVRKQ